MDIKFHFNYDNIKNNKIILVYIKVDPLTKFLNRPKITQFTN